MTNAVLFGGDAPAPAENVMAFRAGRRGAVRLQGEHAIEFRLLHAYKIDEGPAGLWTVHTTGYSYELQLEDGQELVAYHYDPAGRSPITTPHLHVRGLQKPLQLGKAHFPTGRVSLEEVLRFAVRELGVIPLRTNWEHVLNETEKDFLQKKTW